MSGETDLKKILRSLSPKLNEGDFVFCSVADLSIFSSHELIATFREEQGMTVIANKEVADRLGIRYDYIASWITLEIHSSLNAVGLTAAFSTALSKENISCNVVAAYFHDHIFVAKEDAQRAMQVLQKLAD